MSEFMNGVFAGVFGVSVLWLVWYVFRLCWDAAIDRRTRELWQAEHDKEWYAKLDETKEWNRVEMERMGKGKDCER